LALVIKGAAPRSLLSTYTAERLPVIRAMLQRTTGLFGKSTATESFERDTDLYMLGINYRWSDVVVDDRVDPDSSEKKDTEYAYVDRGDGVHAGDRAPEAPGIRMLHSTAGGIKQQEQKLQQGDEVSLFELFTSAEHTAIIFLPSTDDSTSAIALADALSAFPAGAIKTLVVLPADVSEVSPDVLGSLAAAGTVLSDSKGHAFSGYGIQAGRPTVVIVRPDAYVGAYTQSTQGITKYRDMVFGSAVTD
jgi:hypothetical protein